MVEKIQHPIKTDLNQFKLHIGVKNKIELTLHLDSPSRRFYLSLIASVVNKMKNLGKVTSIPLHDHLELIGLLNKTVGSSAGSSEKENLLPRIYMKWKGALPNLEEAPLFRILGMRKEYDEGVGRTYQFTDAEKDIWGNLFEYKGSGENVRLRFSIDRLGIDLDGVALIYEDSLNGEAWEKFISSLKQRKAETDKPVSEEPEVAPLPLERRRTLLPGRHRWVALMAVIVVVLGAIILATWKTYLTPDLSDVASEGKMAFPLPDKPSIAVLPFVNMSGDPKQDFLSDGITEEIVTALSKSRDLFVIARDSTFTYKGKSVKVKQVSEELGVRYVLEGSIQREANRVRITAQFIDALTGHYLWAERYDGDMKQIFALQEKIALNVLIALEKLQKDDARIMGRRAKNLAAYLKAMEGRERFHRQTLEDNVAARKLLKEAIDLDPDYGRAYVLLAATHNMDVFNGTTKSPRESLEQAIKLTKKAIALDPSDGRARAFVAMLYAMIRQWDKGFPEVERALALEPDSPDVLLYAANFLMYVGKYEEAIPLMLKAIRLNPFAHAVHFYNLSTAYSMAGRYEEAIEVAKRGIQRAPGNMASYIALTGALSKAGRYDEARTAAAEVLKANPKFSLERFAKILPYKDQSYIDRTIDALRKAGLK
jgi:TolB-like protein/Tfp pilus assembly protein PilF